MSLLIIFQLGLQRIAYSKFIYICQVFAVAAVMIPLLIILGLKYGMISNMRDALSDNPATLELRLKKPTNLTQKELNTIQSWSETGFAALMSNINGQSVRLGCAKDYDSTKSPLDFYNQSFSCDLKPSSSHDPLMQKASIEPPKLGEIVLSAKVANGLGAKTGDMLLLCVPRNGSREFLLKELRLADVIPETLLSRTEAYADLSLSDEIEEFFRSGAGVAKAPVNIYFDAYDAVVLPKDTNKEDAESLMQSVEDGNLKQALSIRGLEDGTYIIARDGQSFNGVELVYLADSAERNQPPFRIYPWTQPLMMQLHLDDEKHELCVLSKPSLMRGSATLCPAPPELYVNAQIAKEDFGLLKVSTPIGDSEFVCMLKADNDIPIGEAWASPQLHALLKQGQKLLSSWDYRTGSLRYPTARYLSMRIYAKSLDAVPLLHTKLDAAGMSCNSRMDVINQMLRLEHGLNVVFMIICICSGVGGSIALAFNLFNAVERNRRDYALLQLLGGGHLAMVLLPLVESLLITLSAAIIAILVYFVAAATFIHLFPPLTENGAICQLTELHVIYFLATSSVIAFIASIGACVHVLRISPSEIIREF